MKALSLFTPRIAFRVDGCPDPVIEQAVLDTCIDFCIDSGALKQTLDQVLTTANAAEVDLDVPTSYRLVRVHKLWIDGTEIGSPHDDQANAWDFHDTAKAGAALIKGVPRRYVHVANETIRLYPIPDKVYTVSCRAALKPSRSATTVDDALFEDHMDAIVDGALARLLAMPERWGNAGLAMRHQDAYRRGVNRALASVGIAAPDLQVTPVRI